MAEYIEREALLKSLTPDEENETCTLADVFLGLIRKIVEEQPAADAVEVRHGDWVIAGGDVGYEELVCNQCGHSDVIDDYDDLPNYCPNCGAKMDGKGEGE